LPARREAWWQPRCTVGAHQYMSTSYVE
jgi:hypothetical protein